MLSKNYPISHSVSHKIKKLFSYKTTVHFYIFSFPRVCRVLFYFKGTQARENSNVVDRDPQGLVLVLVGWIRFQILVGKNDPQIKKKRKEMCYFKVLMFSLRTGRLSCSLV